MLGLLARTSSLRRAIPLGIRHNDAAPLANGLLPLESRLTSNAEFHASAGLNAWGYENKTPPRGKNRPNKHYHPEWREARKNRIYKVKLPDAELERRMASGKASPAETRDYFKTLGMKPMSGDDREMPIYISCTGAVMEEYDPPEGDGKASFISTEGAKKGLNVANMKRKTLMATRKVRQFEEDFQPKEFAESCKEIYINGHKALANNDEELLMKYATEKAIPEMLHNIKRKTMHWEFVKSIEPPKVVQVRTIDVLSKENLYAQVTVRMNTQQIFVVYDRFGRLIHGSPTVAKDVLEYVVFEKHITNVYGIWRLHGKILPTWNEPRQPSGLLTRVIPPVVEEVEAKEEPDEFVQEDEEESGAKNIYNRFGRVVGKKD